MVDWLEPDDVERLFPDPEQVEAWMLRQLDVAPMRPPEHWVDLARLAGLMPATSDGAASDRMPGCPEPPEPPPP